MKLSTRVREAIDSLLGIKAAPLPFVPTWQKTSWLTPTFDRLTSEGYVANAAVHICVATLALAYQQPLPIVKDADGTPLPQHPLQALLNRPNPLMSWRELATYIATYKAIGGQCYLEKRRSSAGRTVELWPYHAGHVSPIPSPTQWIEYYEYDAGDGAKIRMEKQDVIHLKWFTPDPTQPWLMLPPLRAVAREVDTDSEATRYLFALLINDATPRTVLNVKSQLTEAQFQRLRAQFAYKHGGDNRGGIGVVEGDASITRLSLDMDELAFDALRKVPEARIAAAFRVPAMLAGLNVGIERSIYNNVAEARQSFFEDTIMPLCALDASELAADLGPEFGGNIVIEHDFSKVVALQENEDAVWTRVGEAWADGRMTRNEARRRMGLPDVEDIRPAAGAPPLPPGDAFATASAPAEPPLLEGVIDLPPPPPPRQLTDGKALLIKAQRPALDRIEAAMRKDIERYLERQYAQAAQAVGAL
jgi:HK97 family phage portal protein